MSIENSSEVMNRRNALRMGATALSWPVVSALAGQRADAGNAIRSIDTLPTSETPTLYPASVEEWLEERRIPELVEDIETIMPARDAHDHGEMRAFLLSRLGRIDQILQQYNPLPPDIRKALGKYAARRPWDISPQQWNIGVTLDESAEWKQSRLPTTHPSISNTALAVLQSYNTHFGTDIVVPNTRVEETIRAQHMNLASGCLTKHVQRICDATDTSLRFSSTDRNQWQIAPRKEGEIVTATPELIATVQQNRVSHAVDRVVQFVVDPHLGKVIDVRAAFADGLHPHVKQQVAIPKTQPNWREYHWFWDRWIVGVQPFHERSVDEKENTSVSPGHIAVDTITACHPQITRLDFQGTKRVGTSAIAVNKERLGEHSWIVTAKASTLANTENVKEDSVEMRIALACADATDFTFFAGEDRINAKRCGSTRINGATMVWKFQCSTEPTHIEAMGYAHCEQKRWEVPYE